MCVPQTCMCNIYIYIYIYIYIHMMHLSTYACVLMYDCMHALTFVVRIIRL